MPKPPGLSRCRSAGRNFAAVQPGKQSGDDRAHSTAEQFGPRNSGVAIDDARELELILKRADLGDGFVEVAIPVSRVPGHVQVSVEYLHV